MYATAKSLQSCPTLWDPIDSSPPGSPIPGILQARTLEWVAISFSNVWQWKEKVKSLSRVRPSATPWTAALQAPPSMRFSRQEYWSGMPLLSPWDTCRGGKKSYFKKWPQSFLYGQVPLFGLLSVLTVLTWERTPSWLRCYGLEWSYINNSEWEVNRAFGV